MFVFVDIHLDLPDLLERQRRATRYRKEKSKGRIPDQADEWSDHIVSWLESCVLDKSMPHGDRLLCLRMRLIAGGGCRHDDMRHAPIRHFEPIFWEDGYLRGVLFY